MADLTHLNFREAGIWELVGAGGQVHRHIGEIADRVVSRAVGNLNEHTRTGALAQSIHKEENSDARGTFFDIGSNLPHSTFLEEGTQPHPIQARQVRLLRSAPDHPDPLRHPVPEVSHPGNQPMPFLRPALEQAMDEVQ
jgi:hypothetical protein